MSAILLDRFGIDFIFSIIMDKHLCWLGYISETRLSKIMQFGEMKKKRPAHGPRKYWRNLVSNDG